MRLERLTPGRRAARAPRRGGPGPRPVVGRRPLVEGPAADRGRPRRAGAADPSLGVGPVTVLVPEAGDLHEDEAALRLADGGRRAGPDHPRPGPEPGRPPRRRTTASSTSASPSSSGSTGSTRSRSSPASTARSSRAGDLVASVKVAPHVVDGARSSMPGARIAGVGQRPLVRVAPFRPMRVGGDRQGVAPRGGPAAVRGERPGQGRGPRLDDRRDRLRGRRGRGRSRGAVDRRARRHGPVDVILTAGGRSTDPSDPFFVAIDGARRPGRPARRPGPSRARCSGWPGIGADRDPRPADVRRVLEGDRRRPAPAAPADRRAADPSGPSSHLGHGGVLTREHAVPLPALRPRARRARRLIDPGRGGDGRAGRRPSRTRGRRIPRILAGRWNRHPRPGPCLPRRGPTPRRRRRPRGR